MCSRLFSVNKYQDLPDELSKYLHSKSQLYIVYVNIFHSEINFHRPWPWHVSERRGGRQPMSQYGVIHLETPQWSDRSEMYWETLKREKSSREILACNFKICNEQCFNYGSETWNMNSEWWKVKNAHWRLQSSQVYKIASNECHEPKHIWWFKKFTGCINSIVK